MYDIRRVLAYIVLLALWRLTLSQLAAGGYLFGEGWKADTWKEILSCRRKAQLSG